MLGGTSVAVDPTYLRGPDEAYGRALQNVRNSASWFAGRPGLIDRQSVGSDEEYAERMRTNAEVFRSDAVAHPETYVAGSLPALPFADSEFDVALCSNFLFAYDEFGGLPEHRAAIDELLRVVRGKVMVHPLLNRDGVRPSFYDALIESLESRSIAVRHVPVVRSWLRGAQHTLVLSKTS